MIPQCGASERVIGCLHRSRSTEVLLIGDDRGGTRVLKRLTGGHDERARRAERLRNEGRILEGLRGLAVVHAIGFTREPPSLVLEFAAGGSLHERLGFRPGLGRGWPLPAGAARGLMAELCQVLASVHERGYVHRDLKPSNVLFMRDGSLRLADFGTAAAITGSGVDRSETFPLGTLGYAPPEHLRGPGAPPAPACDVYSLGVMLYEMRTGRLPIELLPGERPSDFIARVGAADRRIRWTGIGPALRKVMEGALERDPALRYPGAVAFRRAVLQAEWP